MKYQEKERIKSKRRKELLEKTRTHQKALSNDLDITAERILVYGKNLFAVGGVLFVGYTILDRYLKAQFDTSKKPKDTEFDSLKAIIIPLLAFALQQGSMVLLKKVRLMLVDYLEEHDDKNRS